MKHTFLKLINLIGFATLVFALPSCLKENDATFTDFSQATDNLTLMTANSSTAGQFLPTGLNKFASGNFNPVSGDSTDFEIIAMFNGEFANKSDVPVSFVVDNAKVTAYNVDTASVGGVVVGNNKTKTQFTPMSSDMYKILPATAVIKAGQRYVRAIVRVYNPIVAAAGTDKSFLLPVSLTTTSGLTVASNLSTLYVNCIGNILAGKYTWRYRRWQSGDTTTAPLQDLLNTVNLSPVSAQQLMTRETYTETFVDASGGIVLGFDEIPSGVPVNLRLSLKQSTLDGIVAGGFTLLDGPKPALGGLVVVGNLASKFIGSRFNTYIQYQNSSGGVRTLVNNFVKIP
jgi:hypothetical protein